jgi:polyferredoxin
MKYNKKLSIRRLVQIFFFALIGLISVNKTLTELGKGIPVLSDTSLHAICPFGGVVTLYNLFTLRTFIKKIHASSVVLMSLIFILAVLFGPVFCGWVCPLGSLQEWIGKIGRKIFKKKFNSFVPKGLDSKLKYLRYAVLVWVVFMTSREGYILFDKIDPYNALFSFWSEEAVPSRHQGALPAIQRRLIGRSQLSNRDSSPDALTSERATPASFRRERVREIQAPDKSA